MPYPVTGMEQLAEGLWRLSVNAPLVARACRPGQFVILRAHPQGERIPLTACDPEPDTGDISVIFQVAGFSTRLMSALRPGDLLQDIVGPLGHPSQFFGAKRIVCVGGGVGTAVVYPQVRYLSTLPDVAVDVVTGARTKDLLILLPELSDLTRAVYPCTDDGSFGFHGFVTQRLLQLLDGESYDLCVVIGPPRMMQAVCQITRDKGLRTVISLNPIMLDGTGMCGCCRVIVDGKVRYACVDGPDFDGHLVDFDSFIRRMSLYRPEERAALDVHPCGEDCRLLRAAGLKKGEDC